jgi:hypothetical protein
MNTFFDWLESLGWQSSLCFLIGLSVAICVLILLIDSGVHKLAKRAELRAIKERNWQQRKERIQRLLCAQREREKREEDDAAYLQRLNIDIANDDAQGRRERGQFHIPAAFRDMKGVQK